jgi:hypothetical protein
MILYIVKTTSSAIPIYKKAMILYFVKTKSSAIPVYKKKDTRVANLVAFSHPEALLVDSQSVIFLLSYICSLA